MVTEVAPGLHRLALPLGIHGVQTVSAYLLPTATGATRWSTAASPPRPTPDGDPGPDGTAALEAALLACGSGLERIERLVVTHAHIDHFGLAGEVVRRSGGELWMHRQTELDLAKYARPRGGRRPARADAGRPRALRARAHRELRAGCATGCR